MTIHAPVKHLIVGGLRSYRPEPVKVRIAPLTLVFGPNSAGKSSLLSVLPLMRQSVHRPDVLTMSGELVEAGTFRQAIHKHDVSLPLTLGIGWAAPDGSTVREGASVYRWDPKRLSARRERFSIDEGDGPHWVDGPRPWGDQPGAAIVRRIAPELFELLDRVAFLGPMRARPERTTMIGQSGEGYVGPAGERMAEILHDDPHLVERVNEWCERLGLGYRVRILTPVSAEVVMAAGDFAVLGLVDIRQEPNVLVSSRAVGYGVGQLLPVIAQCLLSQSGVIIVEQPEVHLHPRLQSAVGDLFIDTVLEGRAQVIVETHSEHLVLRLLRRVREGVIPAEALSILYVDLHEDGGAFVRELEVTSEGELADGWPGGFFDERLEEVLGGSW